MSPVPPSTLNALALAGARQLLERVPEGFRHADLARTLGPEYGRGGEAERKLRRVIDRMRREHVLQTADRGLYVAGPALPDSAALGAGVALSEAVRRLFEDGGGFVWPGEAMSILRLGGEADRRALHRALRALAYRRGLPLLGCRNVWRLRDEQRLKLPLPGSRLALDTRLELRARGEPWAGPIPRELHRRRCEIGEAVRTARQARGVEPEGLLTADLASAFACCLEAGRREHLVPGGVETLGEWWRGRVRRMGLDEALAYTWLDLEAGAANGSPCVADVLDAAFWRTLASRLAADPAALSRGR